MPRSTHAEIQQRKDAIYAFCEEQHPVTVRGIYYHLTTLGLVPKTENGYKRVQNTCARMRREGALPFYWVSDNTRWMRKPQTYNSMQQALQETASFYRRDFLNYAGLDIEIWLEKDALASIFYDVTSKWDIRLMVSRGFASLTFLHDAAIQLQDGAHIYIFSDYDSSGESLAKSIDTGLHEFSASKRFNIKRALLNREQVLTWNLPTRDPKATDRRNGFTFCAELDAIPPVQLRQEVENCIIEHCDPDTLQLLRSIESEERESITNIFNYQEV